MKDDPTNYDTWFNYIRCVEEEGNLEEVRECYERAISNVPLVQVKDYWKRYIYLWIYYALMEEIDAEDYDRCREVYKTCLRLIPHKVFTFAKVWIMYAEFEIRQKDLRQARRTLGLSFKIFR